MKNLSKRGLIRLVSYSLAIIAVLGVFSYNNYSENIRLKRDIKHSYMRAMEDLSLSVDNIKNSLNKGVYAASPEMMSNLSNRLWSDSATAKVSLSQLPMEKLNLESTYKFLSQVGNYSKSLSEKAAAGEEITQEEKDNIAKLLGYCKDISTDLWGTIDQMNQGYITFDEVKENVDNSGEEEKIKSITDSFRSFEDGFQEYPSLIYDGPFSDHILEKKPEILEGMKEISIDNAREKAKKVSNIADLEDFGMEEGKMPSYTFRKDSTTVSITKKGGLLSYMLKYREIGDGKISTTQAVQKAMDYLKKLEITEITDTYFEIKDGLCIINFAGFVDDVTMYTDLIKIGVAMDNGEILSYDARGYINNIQNRQLGNPKLSEKEAREKVSKALTIDKSKLAVIPSEGQKEIYTYEFKCSDSEGQQVLVYINANTGKEEKILILLISDNGTLTV